MPRTPIPDSLIHRPEEVERNGERFDYLCRLTEEVAFPVVQKALFREFDETTAAGAEILTDEAKHALEALAEEAAILEDLDEVKVLEDLQKSLSEALPPPDEEECRQHTRDFSQVLMSIWVESLRTANTEMEILELSDYLLPDEHSSGLAWLMQRFGAAKSKLPESVTDALASFAVNEEDVVTVLTTLREKLFAEPRLVDLPFDLAMVGARAGVIVGAPARVMVMTRKLFDRLLEVMKRQEEERLLKESEDHEREGQRKERKEAKPISVRVPAGFVPVTSVGVPAFASRTTQLAAARLSVPLPAGQYLCFASLKATKLKPARIETSVRRALAAATK